MVVGRASLVVCVLAGALVGPVRADDVPGQCPLEGSPLSGVKPSPWNTAGGTDSDGCRYAVDGKGRLRVVGLKGLLQHKGCLFTLDRPQAELQLSDQQKQQVRAALSAVQPSAGVVNRWELAAVVCRELGSIRKEGVAARTGELYLRAAWAARGEAVLLGPDGGYRPQTLARAARQLAALEQRARADPRRSPEVLGLDASLSDLETVRSSLEPAALLRGKREHLKSLAVLAKMERRLLEDKRALLIKLRRGMGGALSSDQLLEALARAGIRYGDPSRWRPILARLEGTPRTAARAGTIKAACDEEARLLKAALKAFKEGADQESFNAGKARLLFLAGDCARRIGDSNAARALFQQAMDLAPATPGGERAALLLKE